MKVRTRVTNPTVVEVTVQMTMTVKEWNSIRAKFSHSLDPTQAEFVRAITGAVERVGTLLEEEVTLLEATQ
jgi:biopolymer transport protein ExbB/TolQ